MNTIRTPFSTSNPVLLRREAAVVQHANPSSFLDRILAEKRQQVATRQRKIPIGTLMDAVADLPESAVSFREAITRSKEISLIAEIKRASPSSGLITSNFDAGLQAAAYRDAGAAALSVLTEESFFLGSDEHLIQAKASSGLPVLRKDFVVDPYQIYEARLLGASAVLLIVATLFDEEMDILLQASRRAGVEALVEVHTLNELVRALAHTTDMLAINNRNLHTFQVDLCTTERLKCLIPDSRTVVAASGINDSSDLARMYRAGVDAVLIGETLMRVGQDTESLRARWKTLQADVPVYPGRTEIT